MLKNQLLLVKLKSVETDSMTSNQIIAKVKNLRSKNANYS
jgi:hypothetical protein